MMTCSRGFFLFGCFLITSWSWSQVDSLAVNKKSTDCEAKLSIATSEFNAGRFFSLPSILENCLRDGFSKEQKVRAYILLCQVYLITDKPNDAEASYLNLLKADPEYIADPSSDPIDVVYLSKKFTTQPIITPHLRVGLNTSFVSVVQHMNATDQKSSYNAKLGYNFGGGADWNISQRVALCIDLLFSNYVIDRTSGDIFHRDKQDATITHNRIDLPLYLKFQDEKGRFRPYGYVGWAFHLKLSTRAKIISLNEESQGLQFPTASADVSLNSRQYFMNQSLVLGGGIKYKWGKNYLFADLRAQIGFTNATNPEKNISFNNADLTQNAFILDMYRLSSINLSVGYIIPVYNPREKHSAWQANGILGKILYGKQ